MSNLFFYSHLLNRHIIPLASWTRRAIVPCLVLVVCLCLLTKSASAKQIFWFVEDLGDGTAAVVVETEDHGNNPDGFWFLIQHIETGHVFFKDFIPEGNPNPSDPDSGLMPDHEQILNELKKLLGGSSGEVEQDPMSHWLIQGLMNQGKIPGSEIDPWELAGLIMESDIDGGLAGGFGHGIPLGELIGQLKRTGTNASDEVEEKLETEDWDLEVFHHVPKEWGVAEADFPLINPDPTLRNSKMQQRLNDR